MSQQQMQVDGEKEEATIPSTMITPPAYGHSHILQRLDQTALRLCAQLLRSKEIISFGLTCHTLYATLNHPLAWTRAPVTVINVSRKISSTSHTPFLQHFPCIWQIRSAEVTPNQLAGAASRLSQRPYRLVGLQIDASDIEARNEACSQFIQSILMDVRIVNHFSTNVICSTNVRRYPVHFMPDALLSSILQLPQLSSLWIRVESLTDQFANRLAQLQLMTLEVYSVRQTTSSFLPILTSSGLVNSLTKLAFPRFDYHLDDFECLSKFTRLNSLKLHGRKEIVDITGPLSQVHSFKHLYLVADPKWHPDPSTLIDVIRTVNATVTQIDTLSIQIVTNDHISGFLQRVSSADPFLIRIREYLHRRQALIFLLLST